MISHSKQAVILAKVGVSVPSFPARRLRIQERYQRPGARVPQAELEADQAQRLAVAAWQAEVERLYLTYLAQRTRRAPALRP